MRIALLQPCYWPEVRRGTERLVHDLGSALAARKHSVTLITSHVGATSTTMEDGVRVVRVRRPPSLPQFRWYEDHLDSAPLAVLRLLRGQYDVAHAFHPAYAYAAAHARRLGAPPLVFSFHGVPTRSYLVYRRYRLEMMGYLARSAAVSTVLSEQAADPFRRYLLVSPKVVPGGVDMAAFAVDQARREAPTLVCAASLGDPRKGGELLLSAFASLRSRRPEIRLRLIRTPDPFMSPLQFELPQGASWVDADGTSVMAAEYAAAHATVLPSTGEAFGLVALESFASGTPVVAARGEPPADLLRKGETGALFEQGDATSLETALESALELVSRESIRDDCRRVAEPYDWQRLIEPHEALYTEAIVRA